MFYLFLKIIEALFVFALHGFLNNKCFIIEHFYDFLRLDILSY